MINNQVSSAGSLALPLLLLANTAFAEPEQTTYSTTLSFGDAPQNYTLNIPFDTAIDDQYLYLFPDTFEVSESRSTSFSSGIMRSTRKDLGGGSYFEYGPYIRLSSSDGQINLRYEDYSPYIRDYMQVRFREKALEEYYAATSGLTDYIDPSQFEPEIVQVLDRIFDFVVDENARINPIDAPDYEGQLAKLSDDQREVLEQVVSLEDLVAGLEEIRGQVNDELAKLPDIDDLEEYRFRNIKAYDFEAGVHLEYGQLHNAAGIFDQAGWFLGAELGIGTTVYDIEDEGLYACLGPRGRLQLGFQAVSNSNTAVRTGVSSELPFTQYCLSGVTREVSSDPKLFVEVEMLLGPQPSDVYSADTPTMPDDYLGEIRDAVGFVQAYRGLGV